MERVSGQFFAHTQYLEYYGAQERRQRWRGQGKGRGKGRTALIRGLITALTYPITYLGLWQEGEGRRRGQLGQRQAHSVREAFKVHGGGGAEETSRSFYLMFQ